MIGSNLSLPSGYTVLHLNSCGSTNSEAIARGEAGAQSGLWIVADRQDAGRGRSGRSWISQNGNLFTSLLLHLECTRLQATQLSFLAGLAAHEGILRAGLCVGEEKALQLKWPNDIMLDGRKAGGILLESFDAPSSGRFCLVVGIGLNLVHCPPSDEAAFAHLGEGGQGADRWEVFEKLAESMDHWLQIWHNGSNFTAIRNEWLSRAYGLGGVVRVKLPNRVAEGVFLGLDVDGALKLEREDKTIELITSGDVFFPSSRALGYCALKCLCF